MLERIFTFIGWAIAVSVWGLMAALFLVVMLPAILVEALEGDR